MRTSVLSAFLPAGVLLLASPACSQPHLVSSSPPVELGSGATYVVKKVAIKMEYEMKLVFFDTSRCSLTVAVNRSKKGDKSLEAVAKKRQAIAACNGGYFDPTTFLPTGLEIGEGTRTGAYDHVNLPFGGALVVENGKARLLRDEEFADSANITDLVQCCPRLMEGGAAVVGIGGEDPAVRTFLLTDNEDHWALGVINGIGMEALANLLATPGIITEFKVQRALNLDGGPSTGLWCVDTAGTTHYRKEAWPVRNMILLMPRKK